MHIFAALNEITLLLHSLLINNIDVQNLMTSVIKASVSNSLKTRFKILCIENNVTISKMIEKLIEEFIELKPPLPHQLGCSLQDSAIIKGYISDPLKLKFKIFCAQQEIPMNSVLQYLIIRWVEEHP